MKYAILIAILLAGCESPIPPVDAAQVKRNVDAATATVNGLAFDVARLRPKLNMICALADVQLIDIACNNLEVAYAAASVAVDTAHDSVEIYAETGRGYVLVEAGIAAIRKAIDRLRTEAERAQGMVKHVLGEAGGSDRDSGAAPGGPASEAGGAGGEGAGAGVSGGSGSAAEGAP